MFNILSDTPASRFPGYIYLYLWINELFKGSQWSLVFITNQARYFWA